VIDVFKRISVERDHVSNCPFFYGAKGVQPASTKQGKFIVQIDAWNKRPIREIGSHHDLNAGLMHCLNQFDVFQIGWPGASKSLASSLPRKTPDNYEGGKIPSCVLEESRKEPASEASASLIPLGKCTAKRQALFVNLVRQSEERLLR
jgi:hypothetical protein